MNQTAPLVLLNSICLILILQTKRISGAILLILGLNFLILKSSYLVLSSTLFLFESALFPSSRNGCEFLLDILAKGNRNLVLSNPGSAGSTEGSAAADRYSWFNHFVVFVLNAGF